MTTAAFTCFIVVCNPKSTNARNTERRIAEIRSSSPDAEVIMIETSPKGYAVNKRLLGQYADKLGPHTLVCIAAGDGTINSVIEGLLSDPKLSPAARKTPILPLWCGNANDLAHMLNGKSYQAHIAHLLERGQIVKVYPLACTLTGARSETRHAACYTSFGASAYTTQALGRAIRQQTLFHRWPLARFMQELGIVISAMRQAPVFRAAQDGRELTIFECIFFNGPRFAKVVGVRRRLTDRNFHKAIVERKRFSDVMISIFKLSRRNSVALTATQAHFTALDDTWAQFDGEAVEIPAGTDVHITVASRPFYALTTKQ